MKFIVNERCIGCSLCANVCPEVFEMTDEGVARAINDSVTGEETLSSALEARDSCPVDAIESE